MSQTIQQRIEAAIIARFPTDNSVSRGLIDESDLPSGIRHFLLRSLDRRVHLATAEILNQGGGWIDLQHPAVSRAATSLSEALQEAGHFSQSEWLKSVTQSVEAQLAYLQEPARALADFSFSTGSPTLPASDLRRRTGYFSDYPYMAKAVDAWLAKRDEQQIDRNAFESAMRHLDCRLTEEYSEEQWMQLLGPLVETMQFAGVQPAGLPVIMVARFFEAKERPTIADLIRSAAAIHRAEMITLPSLREIIQKAFENERLLDAERNAPSSNTVEPAMSNRETPPVASDPPDSGTAQPLPLWKRFQQRTDGPETGSETSAVQKDTGSQPLWKSFEKPAGSRPGNAQPSTPPPSDSPTSPPPTDTAEDPVPVRPAPKLEAQHIVLGTAVRSRDRFIRDLFDGNEDMYTDIMEHLAEAPGWTEASSIIADRIFRPNRIDIYSDVAVDFTNAVEARYSGLQS